MYWELLSKKKHFLGENLENLQDFFCSLNTLFSVVTDIEGFDF